MNATHFWPAFKWLLMQTLDFVYVPPFDWALLLLLVGLIVSSVWQKAFQRGRWKWHYSLVFTQILFAAAVIAVGTLYRVDLDRTKPLPKANRVADWSINILFFLSLVLGSFWVYRMKGVRWIAFCLVLLQELFLLSAMFIAKMSITGDWI